MILNQGPLKRAHHASLKMTQMVSFQSCKLAHAGYKHCLLAIKLFFIFMFVVTVIFLLSFHACEVLSLTLVSCVIFCVMVSELCVCFASDCKSAHSEVHVSAFETCSSQELR